MAPVDVFADLLSRSAVSNNSTCGSFAALNASTSIRTDSKLWVLDRRYHLTRPRFRSTHKPLNHRYSFNLAVHRQGGLPEAGPPPRSTCTMYEYSPGLAHLHGVHVKQATDLLEQIGGCPLAGRSCRMFYSSDADVLARLLEPQICRHAVRQLF